MCGIAGFVQQGAGSQHWQHILKKMTDSLQHRGPDAEGQWLDLDAGVALGHRRLSIIDLSTHGAQPMVSASGRYVIVYNGEIYNYLEIRRILEARGEQAFRGTSDTEVMLASFEQWGLEASLKIFNGMFSFALWDRETRRLHLARDRMGEKPLYYGWGNNTFLFASELKSLRAHPAFNDTIDRDALTLFMRHNYIPTPYSIYTGVRKLTPGTWLTLDLDDVTGTYPEPVPYWSLREAVERGHQNGPELDEPQAIDQLETLLMDAVRQQMIADVPLGAFLSGGIDSSTIVALMQAQSSQSVKTFSIGFAEKRYNEAIFAKQIAEYLGTDHTELYVSPREALDVIPQLPYLWDEPFADSSQIPTHLVARLARQHVTVSLSGDAGDELFAGYTRYSRALEIARDTPTIPHWQLDASRRLPHVVTASTIWGLRKLRVRSLAERLDRVRKIANAPARNPEENYRSAFMTHWQEPAALVLGGKEPPVVLTDRSQWANVDQLLAQLTYFDMSMYLPDDILVKVDRAAMGVSLETRVPMLDYRVVEFSQRLPASMKLRNGQSKWLLRQVLCRHVPAALVDRPKMGFGVPIDRWLRHELRDWAETLLDPTRLRHEGFLNADMVQQRWREHLSGAIPWHYLLWDVLMFESWLESTRMPA